MSLPEPDSVPRPDPPTVGASLTDRLAAWRADPRVGIAVVLCIALAAGVAWFRSSVGRPAGAAPGAATTSTTLPTSAFSPRSSSTTTPTAVVVHVVGAVNTPGVVTLASGARVLDAVRAAGNATGDADLERLNLAARVVDGQRIAVPRVGEPVPAAVPDGAGTAVPSEPGAASSSAPAAPVNINTATAAELEALPGIGPSTAAAIVRDREQRGSFNRVEDLARVRGIGPAKLAALQGLVTA